MLISRTYFATTKYTNIMKKAKASASSA